MDLILLPDELSVCRLPDGHAVVPPASGSLWSLTQTQDELSLVCPTNCAPDACKQREDGWNALRVAGTLDFSLIGILSPILQCLADAGVSVFTISTYDTDYVLVRSAALSSALEALSAAGYNILTKKLADN